MLQRALAIIFVALLALLSLLDLLTLLTLACCRELKGIKAYLASDRRTPLTDKELGKGSSDYTYIAPLPASALAHVDTLKSKAEL